MAVRVGINGFGRIGRITYRAIQERFPNGEIEVVALNDLTDAKTNAHLLKYDSNYGPYKGGDVQAEGENLIVDGKKLVVFAEKNPADIRWDAEGVDVVIESTGFFTDATKAVAHREHGVKKVSHLGPGQERRSDYRPRRERGRLRQDQASMSSPTPPVRPTASRPVAKVLNDKLRHREGPADHGSLLHQLSKRPVDTAAKDLRDARAAAQNIVPSPPPARPVPSAWSSRRSSGKFTGMAFRVPTPDRLGRGLHRAAGPRCESIEEINAAMKGRRRKAR